VVQKTLNHIYKAIKAIIYPFSNNNPIKGLQVALHERFVFDSKPSDGALWGLEAFQPGAYTPGYNYAAPSGAWVPRVVGGCS
jgi:hypothetical protein